MPVMVGEAAVGVAAVSMEAVKADRAQTKNRAMAALEKVANRGQKRKAMAARTCSVEGPVHSEDLA